jgi:E3 ubiquitin-protein ligase MARCH6
MNVPNSEIPAFSAVSHEALIHIQDTISSTLGFFGSCVTSMFLPPPTDLLEHQPAFGLIGLKGVIIDYSHRALIWISQLPTMMAKSDSWVISLDMPQRAVPVDPLLCYWGGTDRFWAIISGYISFCVVGAAYLRKGSPFSSSQTGREWEAIIIDILHQAGGVMKVILIISIEMLVFPLYCGLLLDGALLPLFANATMLNRAFFTITAPLTSVFIHWFVGTCYMFHFALFVSMCRKILRPGVLCMFP